MAGTVLERELTCERKGGVRFAIATEADDADIRRLLRDNPMPGRISLTLEREPDYFADARLPGEIKQTIIARENGRVVCAGSCAVRERYVNGKEQSVGYLGGLRLDSRCAGRFDIVRRGYNFFRELQAIAPADFYFTSIAADNERARRVLEHGLPGMPRYEFLGEFVTVLLSTTRRAVGRTGLESDLASPDEFLGHVNNHNRQFQFAPKWHPVELAAFGSLGIRTRDFHLIRKRDQILATAAIWDQRVFKQTVIRGYDNILSLVRPAHNLIARLLDRPQLPPVGATLANAFVSHLTSGEILETFVELVAGLRSVAGQRRIELLTMGFTANDPRLAAITSHFPHRQYRSRIYNVCWPNLGNRAGELESRILAPEVALM